MGLDPGLRTGVKVAVVDRTGKVAATAVIYPHESQRRWDEALAIVGKLAKQHNVELISIGNGIASRETDKLATELVKLLPDLKMSKIVVSEGGASVYSASAYASEELPDLDVTLRGAVSIARRLGPRADRAGIVAPRNDSGRPPSRGPCRSAAPARRLGRETEAVRSTPN
jgi:protein Tex